jgi:hypothetical protein
MILRPGIPFSKLWANTVSSNLVALEEAAFQIWTWGRIACLGDSIHKMTPNTGYGGNAAMESAAELASKIKEMVDSLPRIRPDETRIRACLESYRRDRQARAETVVWISSQTTRLQAQRHPLHRVFVNYCIPHVGDYLADTMSDMIVGATAISYLPVPRRSVQGMMPFNPAQGDGREESKVRRVVLIGVPLLVMFCVAMRVMDPGELVDIAKGILENDRGRLPWGGVFLPGLFRVKWLDDL